MSSAFSLESFVQRNSSRVDQLEILYRDEDAFRLHFLPSGEAKSAHIRSHSFLVTCIRNGCVGRHSQTLSEPDMKAFELNFRDWLDHGTLSEVSEFEVNKPAPESKGFLRDPRWCPEADRFERIQMEARTFRTRLQEAWPDLQVDMLVERKYLHQAITNSHGLSCGYQRIHPRATFRLRDPATARATYVTYLGDEDEHKFLEQCDRNISKIREPYPYTTIKGGSSPVLLSPWVLATLYARIVADLSLGTSHELTFPFPETFELWDSTNPHDGPLGVPFDDEGTPTAEKLLAHGRSVQTPISDLALASRHGKCSSGNGFRRGMFFEASSDLPPGPWPCNLLLKRGMLRLEDVLEQEPELVLIEQILIPSSRVARRIGLTSVTFNGTLYRKGKMSARLSGPIENAGKGLLNELSVPVAASELTNNGHFPYVFNPELTW